MEWRAWLDGRDQITAPALQVGGSDEVVKANPSLFSDPGAEPERTTAKRTTKK